MDRFDCFSTLKNQNFAIFGGSLDNFGMGKVKVHF